MNTSLRQAPVGIRSSDRTRIIGRGDLAIRAVAKAGPGSLVVRWKVGTITVFLVAVSDHATAIFLQLDGAGPTITFSVAHD